MSKIVAAVTCDILHSSTYSTQIRSKLNNILKNQFKNLLKKYETEIQTPASFSIVKGDEFQFVISQPEKAYEIIVFYRILAALEKLKPRLSFRCSIGIEEIAIENGLSSYTHDGKAFHLSREGIDFFFKKGKNKKRLTTIRTGNEQLNESLELILMYQDWIEHKWTLEQIEAIRWRYDNLIYENIADQIGVAYQNVQKRLKAADWDLFKNGMHFIERILKNT